MHRVLLPPARPGTRSASPAPPTRAGTRTPAWTRGSRSRSPTPARVDDPVQGHLMTAVRDAQRVGLAAAQRRHPHQPPAARDMRRFADADEVDLVIVGCGAGGATLLQRLARRGWRVVALDAGPFWDPDADWVSDEAGSHHLYWTEPRVIAGADPVPLGSNNSGRGVGGSMVHYAGYTPRFHPSDFDTCHPRRRRRRLADQLRRPAALLPRHRGRAAGRRRALAVGRPALLPAPAAPGRRQRRDLPARRPRARASPPRSVRSPSPTAGSATGRTASTAASACRAARSTPRPRR